MARKRTGSKPRGSGRRTDVGNAVRRGERSIFVVLSKLAVVLIFVFFAIVSAVQNSFLIAALAGVGVFITAKVLLPVEAVSDFLEWLSSGDAGKWLHNTYLKIMPGREDRRGQIGPKALIALAAVALLVPLLLVSGVALADDTNDTATVEHDYLSDESYIEEFEETSAVESTDRNVRTKIEETDAFVRLKAENPNSYPVDMTIKVHPDIIPAAEVGEVSDSDGDVVSTWRNMHDFDSDQSYTEITFQMEPDSEVTFAPSRIRILAISWKDTSTDPSGWTDRLPSLFGEDDLEERTYTLNSSQGTMITVPLEDGENSIDDWNAVYRVGPDDYWKPITTSSSDAAFYRTVDGGEAVQFHFDTDNHAPGNVEIEFTANPNMRDSASHQYRSFKAGWSDLLNFELFSIAAIGLTATAGERRP